MKLYLFFIESDKVPECLMYHYETLSKNLVNGNHVIYACCTSKDIKNQFLLERKNIFTVRTVKIPRAELDSLELDDYMLDYYALNNGDSIVSVLCTDIEYVACSELWHESVFTDLDVDNLTDKHLSILTSEYQNALRTLGLDGMLIKISEDEPDWYDGDMEDLPNSWIWEADYWIRPYNSLKAHIEVNIMLECKEYNVFILQFGSLFDV